MRTIPHMARAETRAPHLKQKKRIVGKDIQERHVKLFQNVRLFLIPGSGHYMLNSHKAESLAAIRIFFRGGE